MSAENSKPNTQAVFELVANSMKRDFKDSEILGLQRLIQKYGPDRIYGLAEEIILIAQNEIPQKEIDIYLGIKEQNGEFGIHNFIKSEVEERNETARQTLLEASL